MPRRQAMAVGHATICTRSTRSRQVCTRDTERGEEAKRGEDLEPVVVEEAEPCRYRDEAGGDPEPEIDVAASRPRRARPANDREMPDEEQRDGDPRARSATCVDWPTSRIDALPVKVQRTNEPNGTTTATMTMVPAVVAASQSGRLRRRSR